MISKLRDWVLGLHGWIWSLPVGGVILAGVVTAGGVGAGGYYLYQSYDFVQHDNDFCMSCHLMQEPFELFAKSAHRGLGCKACHQPSMVERSTMALTQVTENPDELGIHAEVPNERCETCHIEGDPEQWELVANSVGHRIHLESQDTALIGVRCVECHSTSVHEFAAADKTCAQSGCHVDSQIQLGAMSNLTIHCAACHGFSTPLEEGATHEAFQDAIQPDQETCLSCHAMRVLVDMPDPDPHEGSCGSCHNPHEQETPEQAAGSCATAGCHTEMDTLTAFHRGLELSVMEDCASCHEAHDFKLDGNDCLSCHQDIFDDGAGVRSGAAGQGAGPGAAVHGVGSGLSASLAALVTDGRHVAVPRPADVAVGWWAHAPPAQQALDFQHSEHRDVTCASCHESQETHGAVTVVTVSDCRSCHHTEPTSDDCRSCHVDSGTAADPYAAVRSLDLSVGAVAARPLPFEHDVHATEDCATCHTDGLELSAGVSDCASCHEEHHEPSTDCSSCHLPSPESAHPVEQAHATCAGSGCHEPSPFTGMPVTRSACLVCHQDLVDHRPEGDCAECHAMGGGVEA